MRVLLTGATGVLGSEVGPRLRAAGVEVVAVSARGAPAAGVLAWRMGEQRPPAGLEGPFDVVVHCAALIQWSPAPQEAWRGNVGPAEALAAVVGPDTHVVGVSTAYGLGRPGAVDSERLDDYCNAYEWSKVAAERVLRQRFGRVTVVRCPFLVGRRSDGGITRFHGMYTFVHGLATGLTPALVGELEAFMEIVPVDEMAAEVVQAALGPPPERAVVVSVCGGPYALRMRQGLDISYAALDHWRAARGLAPLERAPLIPPERWERFFFPFAREHLSERQLRIVALLDQFRPYVTSLEPLTPTRAVKDMAPVLAKSVLAWADAHPRSAGGSPRPWLREREEDREQVGS
ncbi:MAG TPA: SDR family oxidoreductase [Acidimicrobiia bacterium]